MSETNTSGIGRFKKEIVILLALLVVLVAPFLLRPKDRVAMGSKNESVVIISPHNETIRAEFSDAFSRHMRESEGREVWIDWRVPGGTSEIAKVISSEFSAAFQNHWKKHGDSPWEEVKGAFNNRKLALPAVGEEATTAQRARQNFLDSTVGIGIDLFFGGGAYDFHIQAGAGHLVSQDSTGQYGIVPLAVEKAEWFRPEVLSDVVSGEPFRDADGRWIGTCLSAFGICYNSDSLSRLGFQGTPDAWDDLADPQLIGEIALADPTKSGSATKAFEMIIQQKMRAAVEKLGAEPDEKAVADAVGQGWKDGILLIQRISANARYFTDSASKIPLDVAQGNAAAGMSIDFYGRTYNEKVKQPDGSSRLQYITPVGGSSTGVDPIGMLRGAPHPDLAHAFIRFVLSKEGQRLWNYRPGEPGGPKKSAMRRLPVRRDMYGPEELAHFSDPEVMPYETINAFQYESAWTAPVFNSLRFIIRIMCVDTHHEQKEAWHALIENDFPPRATEIFDDVSLIGYDAATGSINDALRGKDKLLAVRLARDLADQFRASYQKVIDLAEQGQ